jgi:formamidopyrimidine-DNA glycosylase
MTGRLVWSDSVKKAEPEHLRARLLLDGGGGVLFYDVRRFGTIKLHRSLDEARSTGVDPLDRAFSAAGLRRLLGQSQQAIKPWLLRQDRLAGLGNIYASEILFEAGIDPMREAGSLTRDEASRLHRSMRRVLKRAIRHCGTTFSDFQDARGLTGSYQRYLKVYGREGEACSVCGGPLQRVVQQQRSTFFCPRCQR